MYKSISYLAKKTKNSLSVLALAMLLPLIAIGCNHTDEKVTVSNSPVPKVSTTPTPIISNSPAPKSLNTLSDFKDIKQCLIDIKPNISIEENLDKQTKDNYFKADLTYDLNKDGKTDSIHLVLNFESESYLEVNTSKLSTELDCSSLDSDSTILHLVDLNKNDTYTEIACYSKGPSGIGNYKLYRYDGKNLTLLGEVLTDTLSNEAGKLVPMTYYNYSFKPLFCSAWYEIENNSLVLYENDTKQFLNKTYQYERWEVPTFFMPCETMPDTIDNLSDNAIDLSSCNVKLLGILYSHNNDDMDRLLNYYYVQLPSGEKGVLYFSYWT